MFKITRHYKVLLKKHIFVKTLMRLQGELTTENKIISRKLREN